MTRFPFATVAIIGVDDSGLQFTKAFCDNGVAVILYDNNEMRCAQARRDVAFGVAALLEAGDTIVTSNPNAIAIADLVVIMPILFDWHSMLTVVSHVRKTVNIVMHKSSITDRSRLTNIIATIHPFWINGQDYTVSQRLPG